VCVCVERILHRPGLGPTAELWWWQCNLRPHRNRVRVRCQALNAVQLRFWCSCDIELRHSMGQTSNDLTLANHTTKQSRNVWQKASSDGAQYRWTTKTRTETVQQLRNENSASGVEGKVRCRRPAMYSWPLKFYRSWSTSSCSCISPTRPSLLQTTWGSASQYLD
jgi:hypothetical protein